MVQVARRRSAGGGPAVSALPTRLRDSWERSEGYGVSPESVEPVFTGTPAQESLFVDCGREVLTALHRTLLDEPLSLMLTDADGLVLDRLSGDTSLLSALDAVHLAPGFAYAERDAGTNGLGLALADRLPSLVRAEEHYSASLCVYTCAAVPVLDPLTGRLEGAVNVTTWSRSSTPLLLALAQSAASNTSSLMLARSRGPTPRPVPRGEVFRVLTARLEPGSGALPLGSTGWAEALEQATAAVREGRSVLALGERGSGRTTLVAQAVRRARPRERILAASPPAPDDVEAWLAAWGPELDKPGTTVVLRDVDALASSTADRLRAVLGRSRGDGAHWAMTADDLDTATPAVADAVVRVPCLRERPADVVPLFHHLAQHVRRRDVGLTAAATRVLEQFEWPGNVEQLKQVVRHAVARADTVDVAHLPTDVVAGSPHRLGRIELLERDELARCLARPGTTVQQVADELGMSRATVYRKIKHYGLSAVRS